MRRALVVLCLALPVAAAEEILHEVRLKGGSVLVGRLAPAEWLVTTPFGPLTVPAAEIRRIRFGRKADPERFARVQSLLEDLGSTNPDRREQASAALKAEGEYAAPSLAIGAKSHPEPEARRICQELLSAIDAPEEGFPSDDDSLQTTRFEFTGTVSVDSITVAVPELGSLTVSRKHVREIRVSRAVAEQRFRVTGDMTFSGTWLDTNLKIPEGAVVRIRADGQISFPQWNNNTFSPDGSFNAGRVNNMPIGCLAGRIGPAGEVFRIGSAFSGSPTGRGTLQICCLVQFSGQPTAGEWRVRIEID